MKDKTKIYNAYFRSCSANKNQSPNRANVKILFEDSKSFYVESLIRFDRQNFGVRYSLKKHYFILVEIQVPQVPGKSDVCKDCPLRKIVNVMREYDI